MSGNISRRLFWHLRRIQIVRCPGAFPGVDVEAKLEADGGLTIGVFAPEDMLDQERVRWVLGQIREVLENDGGVE